jgi:hypothetical protein
MEKEVISTKLKDVSMRVIKYENLRDFLVARSCPLYYSAFDRRRYHGMGGFSSSL